MQIIDTRHFARPNTSTPFFNEGYTSARLEHKVVYDELLNSGALSREITVSDDGLTQSVVTTYNSLEAYSTRYTSVGIELNKDFFEHCAANNITTPVATQQGIDVPFTCTVTYTYNENTSTLFPEFEEFINQITRNITLEEFTNTGTQLIAVFRYENSADYTATRWQEGAYVVGLFNGGVTRTMEFALV